MLAQQHVRDAVAIEKLALAGVIPTVDVVVARQIEHYAVDIELHFALEPAIGGLPGKHLWAGRVEIVFGEYRRQRIGAWADVCACRARAPPIIFGHYHSAVAFYGAMEVGMIQRESLDENSRTLERRAAADFRNGAIEELCVLAAVHKVPGADERHGFAARETGLVAATQKQELANRSARGVALCDRTLQGGCRDGLAGPFFERCLQRDETAHSVGACARGPRMQEIK